MTTNQPIQVRPYTNLIKWLIKYPLHIVIDMVRKQYKSDQYVCNFVLQFGSLQPPETTFQTSKRPVILHGLKDQQKIMLYLILM